MKVSQRRFGVEIEHGGTRGVQRLNQEVFGMQAMPVGSDGSGIELRTPPLKGVKGFKKLERIMDLIVENGGWTSWSDGMHVHFEALDYIGNPKAIGKLIRTWNNLCPVFMQLVAPYRFERGAQTWTKEADEYLRKGRPIVPGGRQGLNLSQVIGQTFRNSENFRGRKKTIEVRLHEGTVDKNIAVPWIHLMQAIFDDIIQNNRTIREHRSVKALCNRVGIDGEIRDRLIDRASRPIPNPGDRYSVQAWAARGRVGPPPTRGPGSFPAGPTFTPPRVPMRSARSPFDRVSTSMDFPDIPGPAEMNVPRQGRPTTSTPFDPRQQPRSTPGWAPGQCNCRACCGIRANAPQNASM